MPVFIMDPRHPLFEPDTSARYRPLIARASGPLGTNAQYLFRLSRRCASWACTMPVSMTVASVRALLGESPTPGPPERARKRPA